MFPLSAEHGQADAQRGQREIELEAVDVVAGLQQQPDRQHRGEERVAQQHADPPVLGRLGGLLDVGDGRFPGVLVGDRGLEVGDRRQRAIRRRVFRRGHLVRVDVGGQVDAACVELRLGLAADEQLVRRQRLLDAPADQTRRKRQPHHRRQAQRDPQLVDRDAHATATSIRPERRDDGVRVGS